MIVPGVEGRLDRAFGDREQRVFAQPGLLTQPGVLLRRTDGARHPVRLVGGRGHAASLRVLGVDAAFGVREHVGVLVDAMDAHAKNLRTLAGDRPTFYPVFANLLDNSIYWMSRRSGDRVVQLDVDGDKMIFSDSGSGISKSDRESLFQRGFTRKPAGRGLGLYISRGVLNRDGYEIESALSGPLQGATFEIAPRGGAVVEE